MALGLIWELLLMQMSATEYTTSYIFGYNDTALVSYKGQAVIRNIANKEMRQAYYLPIYSC